MPNIHYFPLNIAQNINTIGLIYIAIYTFNYKFSQGLQGWFNKETLVIEGEQCRGLSINSHVIVILYSDSY